MSGENYQIKSEFMAIIYNPSVFEKDSTMIPMQIPLDVKGNPQSNVSVHVWDKQTRMFTSCSSETICYKKP